MFRNSLMIVMSLTWVSSSAWAIGKDIIVPKLVKENQQEFVEFRACDAKGHCDEKPLGKGKYSIATLRAAWKRRIEQKIKDINYDERNALQLELPLDTTFAGALYAAAFGSFKLSYFGLVLNTLASGAAVVNLLDSGNVKEQVRQETDLVMYNQAVQTSIWDKSSPYEFGRFLKTVPSQDEEARKANLGN